MSDREHNPKYVEALKRGKLDYSTVPWSAVVGVAQAMAEGAGKYGRFNFREDKIEARTYIAAILRHLFGDPSTGSAGWVNGEDIDVESGLHHLHKVMACCALVLDAQDHGMLIDNRLATESLPPPSTRDADFKGLKGPATLHDDVDHDIDVYESSLGWLRAPGWYVKFHDVSPGLDESWEHYAGPFLAEEDAREHAATNPDRIAGERSIFYVK